MAMHKNRLLFRKSGRAVYISHLDLMATFQRAFLRSGVEVWHTEGFNRHVYVSIALPLSVGYSSDCEILEFNLEDDTPLARVPERLNAVLPEGVEVLSCYEAKVPLKKIVDLYEDVTRMHVYERTPYAGALVFAAFSGSHQDAIAKGMKWREDKELHQWTVPYIPIDPKDIGRTYDGDIIRINSQSGKGGIGYLLEQKYGYDLPPKMREHFGYKVKEVSDRGHCELQPDQVFQVFCDHYLNRTAPLNVPEAHYIQSNGILTNITICNNGVCTDATGRGNGRLDAVSNAIKNHTGMDFSIQHYSEHSLSHGSNSDAVAYVGITWGDGQVSWGAGTDSDIIKASIKALVSAINQRA